MLHDHAPDMPGLVTVVGGKLTTFRQLSQDAVDDVFRRLGRKSPPCTTKQRPTPGAVFSATELKQYLSQQGLSQRSLDRLIALYGGRARDVVAEAQNDKALLNVIHEPSGAIGAELIFAMKREFASSLTDVLARRLLLAFQPSHALESVDAIARLVGERMGWTAKQRAAEIAEYRAWLSHLAVPRANAS